MNTDQNYVGGGNNATPATPEAKNQAKTPSALAERRLLEPQAYLFSDDAVLITQKVAPSYNFSFSYGASKDWTKKATKRVISNTQLTASQKEIFLSSLDLYREHIDIKTSEIPDQSADLTGFYIWLNLQSNATLAKAFGDFAVSKGATTLNLPAGYSNQPSQKGGQGNV